MMNTSVDYVLPDDRVDYGRFPFPKTLRFFGQGGADDVDLTNITLGHRHAVAFTAAAPTAAQCAGWTQMLRRAEVERWLSAKKQGNPLLLTPGEKPGGNGDSVIPKPRTSPTPASLIKGVRLLQRHAGGRGRRRGAAAAAAAVAMVAAPAATTAAGVARRERLRGFEQLARL